MPTAQGYHETNGQLATRFLEPPFYTQGAPGPLDATAKSLADAHTNLASLAEDLYPEVNDAESIQKKLRLWCPLPDLSSDTGSASDF